MAVVLYDPLAPYSDGLRQPRRLFHFRLANGAMSDIAIEQARTHTL